MRRTGEYGAGGRLIKRHTDLDVYRAAFELAMQVFELSQRFPQEERYALTDQIRRSSRSVCANPAEAWRKRRYEAAFASKLNDCEAEAAETQVWLQFSVECKYLARNEGRRLFKAYEQVIGMLVRMGTHSGQWTLRR
jgi:four helix bundle protein